jgi:hypothetical protein
VIKAVSSHFPFLGHIRNVFSTADPLEVLFLFVFMVSGAAQAVSGAKPGSINALLPETFRIIWLILLTVGSLIALVGIFWPWRTSDGIITESIGLAWVAISIVVYGAGQAVAVSFSQNPGGAILSGPLTICLGLAFWFKHRRLQALIDRLKE